MLLGSAGRLDISLDLGGDEELLLRDEDGLIKSVSWTAQNPRSLSSGPGCPLGFIIPSPPCAPQAKPNMSLVRRRLPFGSNCASTMPSKLHDAAPLHLRPGNLGPQKVQLPYPAIMTGQCRPAPPCSDVMHDKGSVAVLISLHPLACAVHTHTLKTRLYYLYPCVRYTADI